MKQGLNTKKRQGSQRRLNSQNLDVKNLKYVCVCVFFLKMARMFIVRRAVKSYIRWEGRKSLCLKTGYFSDGSQAKYNMYVSLNFKRKVYHRKGNKAGVFFFFFPLPFIPSSFFQLFARSKFLFLLSHGIQMKETYCFVFFLSSTLPH